MRYYVIILLLLLQGCFWVTCVEASEADLEWQDAIGSVKQAEYDFAFLDFQTIADDYPNSGHALPAAFALGEYYFLQKNLPMAADAFKDFYIKYPQHEEALMAIAYLYKIAQLQNNTGEIKKYHAMVASFRQLTFVFSEKKVYKFFSAFQRKHQLVYTINKVELYVNGQLFTAIPF